MGYEMSDDFHERTKHHGYRAMDWAMGMGDCPWFWVIMYDPSGFLQQMKQQRELQYG
ncbi:MAG: hypothetical protein CM15mP83_2740 [Flavobacteriaceae bacterium]|nr:MAG: hypothetical protein CM15mP83_2740 [Flavobacteriaceae bacterium]